MTFPETDPDPDDSVGAPAPLAEPEASIGFGALHEELVAGSAEARRGNRRTLEVLKNFGAVLDALSATVNDTHKAVRALPAAAAPPLAEGGGLPREWALALADLADRIDRVDQGFSQPPAAEPGWWPGARKRSAAWSEAWATQADALRILRGHTDALLTRAGLERLQPVGQAFDPSTMTAVESAVDADKPDHTVLAELLPGWCQATSGELLRPAQVRVSRLPK